MKHKQKKRHNNILMPETETFYNPNHPDALAYTGIGGAALIEQAKIVPRNPASTWDSPEQRETVLKHAEGKTIAWDFDGVVADTEPTQWDSFRALLTEYNFVPPTLFHETLMGLAEPLIWENLFNMGAPRHDIATLMAERSEIYLMKAKQKIQPSWLVTELMPLFAETATKQYVVSNGNRVNNMALLTHWDMLKYVDVVDRGPATKAELVESYARATPSVFLEDNPTYARIAKNNGAFVVGVIHGLSLTQYIPSDVTVHI